MTQADQLRQRLSERPFLLVDCVAKRAMLADQPQTIAALGKKQLFIMNLKTAFEDLGKLAGTKDKFSLSEIARIAGCDYFTAYDWMRKGALVASIRPVSGHGRRGAIFSFTDGVVAAIIGTLRRHGLSHDLMAAACQLLTGPQTPTKKRTDVRIAAASRS
jgi:hypothetical protein